MSKVFAVEVMPSEAYEQQDFDYDRLISDPETREWAESAAGFITFGLGQAVLKVLEAGNLLVEAKQRLPHGEYLPWVQQACKLKPQYASKLIKAAEWANVAHVQHLDGVTDTATLFLLSADTTQEEVREWFMERCAAGSPPTRKEVQDRKRSAGQLCQLQPAEELAFRLISKGEIERVRQALALADGSKALSAQQVMDELRLRDLGKQNYIAGIEANFRRMKDGRWIKMPHSGCIDAPVSVAPEHGLSDFAECAPKSAATIDLNVGLMSLERAAEILGMAKASLQHRLAPCSIEKHGRLLKKGYMVTKEGRGMVRLSCLA